MVCGSVLVVDTINYSIISRSSHRLDIVLVDVLGLVEYKHKQTDYIKTKRNRSPFLFQCFSIGRDGTGHLAYTSVD